jgi:hypothetical protein
MPKPDKRKNAKVKRGNVFYIEWIHSDYLEYWLRDFTADGSLLHVCSGESTLGYPRVDINPDSNRTMHGDLFDLLSIFKENQFDYVYCDPPFPYYNDPRILKSNRNAWQFDLLKIAKKALITRRPRTAINLPSKYHDYVILEDSRPSISILRVDYK